MLLGKKIKKKNGINRVLVYCIHGCFWVRNQKYLLQDGLHTDYLTLYSGLSSGPYSSCLCDFIEDWSDDLSYAKTSKLLLQLTGTEVLSSSGVQSYLERRAESISKSWVAKPVGDEYAANTVFAFL